MPIEMIDSPEAGFKTVTVQAWLRYRTSDYWKEEERLFVSDNEDDSEYSILIKTLSIEVTIPAKVDPRPQLVKVLEKKRETLRGEYTGKLVEIDTRIQELQAIEYTPEAECSPI